MLTMARKKTRGDAPDPGSVYGLFRAYNIKVSIPEAYGRPLTADEEEIVLQATRDLVDLTQDPGYVGATGDHRWPDPVPIPYGGYKRCSLYAIDAEADPALIEDAFKAIERFFDGTGVEVTFVKIDAEALCAFCGGVPEIVTVEMLEAVASWLYGWSDEA